MMRVRVLEKINLTDMSQLTGLKEEILAQVITVGDTLKIGPFRYKVVHYNGKTFVCERYREISPRSEGIYVQD